MFGAFYNQGEICNATTRVLIEKPIHHEVVARVCAETRKLKIGAPAHPATQMGPLQNQPQLDKFLRYVSMGSADGARLLCGGDRHPDHPRGYFVRPAVFDAVPLESSVWREEVFGPLLAIRAFTTEAEAVEAANDSDFGLAAAVLSADSVRSQRVAQALDAGCGGSTAAVPPSCKGLGVASSAAVSAGVGRWGLEGYLEVKQVTRYRSTKAWGWYLKEATR